MSVGQVVPASNAFGEIDIGDVKMIFDTMIEAQEESKDQPENPFSIHKENDGYLLEP